MRKAITLLFILIQMCFTACSNEEPSDMIKGDWFGITQDAYMYIEFEKDCFDCEAGNLLNGKTITNRTYFSGNYSIVGSQILFRINKNSNPEFEIFEVGELIRGNIAGHTLTLQLNETTFTLSDEMGFTPDRNH